MSVGPLGTLAFPSRVGSRDPRSGCLLGGQKSPRRVKALSEHIWAIRRNGQLNKRNCSPIPIFDNCCKILTWEQFIDAAMI